MKKVYIGADSAGYELKEILKAHLTEGGYTVLDMGCNSTASCHYPLFAAAV
ncbi:MAG: RpiB/LacA/LacB family sugar-phosphate isomerase, partial [Clostridia bacterium]|nr:RpiB/LacA/LacB family sugar-phosphate isomerase [Clostridia bacterium]